MVGRSTVTEKPEDLELIRDFGERSNPIFVPLEEPIVFPITEPDPDPSSMLALDSLPPSPEPLEECRSFSDKRKYDFSPLSLLAEETVLEMDWLGTFLLTLVLLLPWLLLPVLSSSLVFAAPLLFVALCFAPIR